MTEKKIQKKRQNEILFLCFFSLLASASRDRLIHVFDTCREYGFVHTLDDHSSSITAIRFLKMPPRPGVENSVQIASCGADKSIIFRDISSDHKGGLEFTRGNHIVGKTTLYDMETDVSKPTPSSFTSTGLLEPGGQGGGTAPPLLLKFHQNSFQIEVFA